MRRAERYIKEKRLSLVLGAPFNIGHRFFGESGQVMDFIQLLDHLVVFNNGIHMTGVMNTVEIIKSTMYWPIGDGGPNRSPLHSR